MLALEVRFELLLAPRGVALPRRHVGIAAFARGGVRNNMWRALAIAKFGRAPRREVAAPTCSRSCARSELSTELRHGSASQGGTDTRAAAGPIFYPVARPVGFPARKEKPPRSWIACREGALDSQTENVLAGMQSDK